MAYKSKKLTKRKTYTKSASEKKATATAVKEVYIGDEPSDQTLEQLDDRLEYIRALQWYNYSCTTEDARAFLEDYLEEIGNKHMEAIQRVPDKWLSLTACWIARLMSRGAVLPETSVPFFKAKLKEMAAKSGTSVELDGDGNPIEKSKTEKATVQENIRGRAAELISEIEGMIDDGIAVNGWSAYEWLTKNQASSVVASKLVDKFQPILHELFEVQQKTDKDLIEGYRHLSTKQLKLMIGFYQALIDDTTRYSSVNKKVKAPRKKKAPTVEKKLKFFKYMQKSDEHKLASIAPDKILKANELWTFNTTNNILTVYRTTNGDVLDVHRTAITHFEPKMSMSKRIGRNTEDVLKYVLESGKVQLRKVMDGISSGPAPFSDRIHDKIILLRAV